MTAETVPGQQSPLERAERLLQGCVAIDELASTATPDERLRMTINRAGEAQRRAEAAAESAAAVAAAQALTRIADAAEASLVHLGSIATSLDRLSSALDRGALLVQVRGR